LGPRPEPELGPTTVREALRTGASRLASAGVPLPEADAERLLCHVLAWDRARLLAEARSSVPPAAAAAFRALTLERARRRPIQHLTGTQEFWRHSFLVTPDVLIPRPETEILVEAALEALRGKPRPRIADVGTGSGCIALSLAAEIPDALVYALDISEPALAVARENARRLGLEERVAFRAGDLLAPLRGEERAVDLVAANPPYVDPTEREQLPPEVRDYEPSLALFPPGDRLAVYRRLIPDAASVLERGGRLLLEIGLGMDGEVATSCEGGGFGVERVVPDLRVIPRVVVARRA
jgi:release factor glutamine methyltransferase